MTNCTFGRLAYAVIAIHGDSSAGKWRTSATRPIVIVELGTYTIRGDVNTFGVLRFTAPGGSTITVPASATDSMAVGVDFTLVLERTTRLMLAPAAGITVLGRSSVAAETVKRLTKLAANLRALF
jgi:hypothetical protein